MDDPRIAIWNVLHDGEITALAGEGTETVTLFVSIPYLRRRMEPLGDSFVLTLSGVRQLQFRDFSGSVSSLTDELQQTAPEILSTVSEQMPITVATTAGELLADFDDIHIACETGESVSYEVVDKISEEYWDEWDTKSKKV